MKTSMYSNYTCIRTFVLNYKAKLLKFIYLKYKKG